MVVGEKDDFEDLLVEGENSICSRCTSLEVMLDKETGISLAKEKCGFIQNTDTGNNEIVSKFTFTNENKMKVQILSLGATIMNIFVPDRQGKAEDVVLGFDNYHGYIDNAKYYIGPLIGRVANRISRARFCINKKKFELEKNDNGKHHYNGGTNGFHTFNFIPHVKGTTLTLTHLSKSKHANYPGDVLVTMTYKIKTDNSLHVTMTATATEPTPINLSQSVYFNLANHGAGHEELYKHVVTFNSDKHVLVDEEKIPTGCLQCVGGTCFDLRIPHELGPAISRCAGGGFNMEYNVTRGSEQTMTYVGRVIHPRSGRVMEIYSDQECIKFDTCCQFPEPYEINPPETYSQDYYELPGFEKEAESSVTETFDPHVDCKSDSEFGMACEEDENVEEEEETIPVDPTIFPIDGKKGAKYMKHCGFSICPQAFPNAVNQRKFDSIIVCPGELYKQKIIFKFGIHVGVRDYEEWHMDDEADFDEEMGEEEGGSDEFLDVTSSEDN